ncbi:MspA family porin [Nocardia sp. NPDC004860]|uniref:MspA family porin n=1 Tax=Nocardia sp. NPDC004860 TaxID=3154557 RepID=UPI0033BEC5B3
MITAHVSAAYAPHEKTYSTTSGFAFTVGQRDLDARPIAPLNGMPTNREVFLDSTSYGTVPAGATGHLKTGYYVACQADIDAKLHIDPELDLNPTVTATAGLDTSLGPHAGVDLSVGPTVTGGVGVDISIAPGKIADVVAGEKDLPGNGGTGTLLIQDFHLMVGDCGGPLTIRPYTLISADSGPDGGSGAVYGDPITL